MKRGAFPFAILLVLAALLAGCVQSTEVNPEHMSDEDIEALENYVGSVRVETISGMIYKAQTLKSAYGDSLELLVVEVIDDGVVSHKPSVTLAKSKVSSLELSKNSPWVVGGAIAGISILILVLYYQINGSF